MSRIAPVVVEAEDGAESRPAGRRRARAAPGPRQGRLDRAAPWLFALFAAVTALFLAWNLPPFMAPDELAHALRADSVSRGDWIGHRIVYAQQPTSAGAADIALGLAYRPFAGIVQHRERRADLADYATAGAVRWRDPPSPVPNPVASLYAPFLYVPAAVGLGAGRAAGLSVVASLYLARMTNALACILVGALAIGVAGRARLLIYALLLLPMTQAMFGAVTPDGMLIALTALGCGLVSGAMSRDRPLSDRQLALAAACFALVGVTKAPYAPFALTLLWAPAARPRLRWPCVALSLALSVAWPVWMALAVETPQMVRAGLDISPAGQLRYLLADPGRIVSLAARTLGSQWRFYVESFIGSLGSLDVPLPRAFHAVAWAGLGVALLLCCGVPREGRWAGFRLAAAGAAATAFIGIFAAIYLTWVPVGDAVVTGVQGRYFIPLALLLAVAACAGRLTARTGPAFAMIARLRATAVLVVLSLPLLSAAVVAGAVIARYYLD